MCGGSILSCFPRKKFLEEEEDEVPIAYKKYTVQPIGDSNNLSLTFR